MNDAEDSAVAGIEIRFGRRSFREGAVVNLSCDEVSIGRSRTAEIPLLLDIVSRQHCRLIHEDGRWFVEDLGSSNGTLLNGKSIEKGEVREGSSFPGHSSGRPQASGVMPMLRRANPSRNRPARLWIALSWLCWRLQ